MCRSVGFKTQIRKEITATYKYRHILFPSSTARGIAGVRWASRCGENYRLFLQIGRDWPLGEQPGAGKVCTVALTEAKKKPNVCYSLAWACQSSKRSGLQTSKVGLDVRWETHWWTSRERKRNQKWWKRRKSCMCWLLFFPLYVPLSDSLLMAKVERVERTKEIQSIVHNNNNKKRNATCALKAAKR